MFFACVFFVAELLCVFVLCPSPSHRTRLFFLEKTIIIFCYLPPVHLLTSLLLFFAIDFRLRLFSWWRAFDWLFSLLVGCRLQAGRFGSSAFPFWRCAGALLLVAFPRSSGWTMHECRVVPCSNLDEVLPGSPEPGGKFFLRACCI